MAKAGRPNREFTEDEIALAEDMAYNWCQTRTIATKLGVDKDVVERNLGPRLRLKRAEAKFALRKRQMDQSTSTPVMSIFLGKNYLGQADKQDITHGLDADTVSLLGLVDGQTKGVLPSTEQPIDTSRTVEPDMADPSDTDPQNQAKNRAETG